MSAEPTVDVLGDDLWVCQVGRRRADGSFHFTDRPRPMKDPPEQDVSWLIGRLDPASAVSTAFGRSHDAGKDAVRFARIGDLRAAGFRVQHTPRWGSPAHVSVFWPLGEWGDREAALMDACCTEGGT